jgi:hypothetical protein
MAALNPYMLCSKPPNTRHMGTRLGVTVNGNKTLGTDFFVKNRLTSDARKEAR